MPTVELSDGEVVVFRDGQLIRARATYVEVTHNEFTGMALLRTSANVDTIQYNQLPIPSSRPLPSPNRNGDAETSTFQSDLPAGRLIVAYVVQLVGGIQAHIPCESRLYVFPDQLAAFVYREGAYRATNISAGYVRQHFIHGEYFNGPPDNRGPGENWFAVYNNGDFAGPDGSWVTVQGSRCYVPRESLIRDSSWYAVPAIERPAPAGHVRGGFPVTTLPDGWHSVSNSGQDNAQRLSQSGALPEAFRRALAEQQQQQQLLRQRADRAADAFLTESAGQLNQPAQIVNTTTNTNVTFAVANNTWTPPPMWSPSPLNAWGLSHASPPRAPLPPEPKHTPIPISDGRPRRLLLQD